MEPLKIGIIEDEILIANSISDTLLELGYLHTQPCMNYTEAIKMIENESPDILLVDIVLSGKKDGIDLAKYINENFDIPFIFLTANSDPTTLERAKEVNPQSYLIKPFNKNELFASIEIALSNYSKYSLSNKTNDSNLPQKSYMFIRDNYAYTKVYFKEIEFAESDGNYVKIPLVSGKNILVRTTFKEFVAQLPNSLFYRTGRRHVIQIELISKIKSASVLLNKHEIPLSKVNRVELLNLYGLESA